jgi:TonB-linked SusC/RagA family outer membrane protein
MMKKFLLVCFLLVFVVSAWAQERTISGRVTSSEDGSPLPGVNVILKGTSTGTATDADGRYTLSVPASGGMLVFSFIGLESKEIVIGDRAVIDISLALDVTQLSEVVVTAIGIEADKRTLGYSIQTVASDQLVNARETNLVNALNAKVAGVSVVTSSGSPGSSANIRVRGSTSINGNNSPLFVVDGVPIDNSSVIGDVAGVDYSNRAIDLNPNDIESLTVLKGPAATALYGIRAANGAIIITTKKGAKRAKPSVVFSSAFTMDQVNKLPELQKKWAQGRPVNGVLTWRGPHTGEGFSYGPRISDLEFDGSEYLYDKNGRLVPKGTGNGTPARAYDAYDFFITGYTFDNNISVSGGTDKSSYYLSAGKLSQTGVVPNADFERTSFKVTINTDVTDRLHAGMSATYVNSGGQRIQKGSNISGVMLGLARNTPTFDMGNGKKGQAAADDPSSYELPDGSQRSYRGGIYDSPYWTVNKNPYNDDVNRVIGNANVSYDFTKWLKASYKLGVDYYSERSNWGFDIGSADSPDGAVFQDVTTSSNLNSDLLFILNREITSDLRFDAVLGHNFFSTNAVTQSAQGRTLGAPGFLHISNASDIQAQEFVSRRKVHGVFANVNLDYKNFLFLNLSGRNDWSSTLPKDNNSFFYPAVSLGFAFTEAFGLSDNNILPYGKLRVSYGQVGNDALLYVTSSYFNSASVGGDGFITNITFPAFGTNSFSRSGILGNDKLKAETTTTIEFGGDFKFLEGKIGLDITYYDAKTIDQIVSVDLPAPTGFTGLVQNAGTIRNKGLEVSINANVLQLGDFKWDIDLNFTKYETIVESLPEGVDNIILSGFTSTSSRVVAGQPYGVIYGAKYQRNSDGKRIIGDDGWPLLDASAGVVGNPTPDWIAGLRNTFSYKGFSLSALLDIRKGGDVWNGTTAVMDYFGTSKRSGDLRDVIGFVFDGVKADGSPNTTPVDFGNPSNGIAGYRWQRYGFGEPAEDAVEDASWVRLRELTLSYSIPSVITSKLRISGATISLTGRNLFLLTGYRGIDPETNLTGADNGIGLDYFNMPNTKSYGAALRVTF